MLVALLGILCALILHGGFILFGGLLFGTQREQAVVQEVELLSDDVVEDEEEEEELAEPETSELAVEAEEVPDAEEVLRSLELSAAAAVPELEAASLSAIEAALSGLGGSGEFVDVLSLSSGGRISGTGKVGEAADELAGALDLAEIDQKPRVLFQATPLYPAELRKKKLEGVVKVLFVVDAAGKVTSPRAEQSTHPAFVKPALDAVRQWKFEPAVKGGQRVGCKMRVDIRFRPS